MTNARTLVLCMAVALVAAGCASTPDKTVGGAAKQQEATTPMGISPTDDDGLVTKDFDLNGDKKADLIKYYRDSPTGDVLVRKEADLNGDKRVDVWVVYDEDGQKAKERFDLDFDGRVDLMVNYKDGVLTSKEIDYQFDERTDIWKYYMDGRLIRREVDMSHDGNPDYWEFYNEQGQLYRVGRDTDDDGQIDTEQSMQPEAPEAAPHEAAMEDQAAQTTQKVEGANGSGQ